jgi:DNA replicative helicase MCM subunit Mcm2 (Cdc46/Mcm family)
MLSFLVAPLLLLLVALSVRRQLEALIRISESFARMSLAGEADDGHVAAAFDLFTKSTINAMNAGLINSSTERLEVSKQGGSRSVSRALTRIGIAVCVVPGLNKRSDC